MQNRCKNATKKGKFKSLGGDLNGGIFHIPLQKRILLIPLNIAISTRCVLELSEHHVVVVVGGLDTISGRDPPDRRCQATPRWSATPIKD